MTTLKRTYRIEVVNIPNSDLCMSEKKVTADNLNTCPAKRNQSSLHWCRYVNKRNLIWGARIGMAEADELVKDKNTPVHIICS